MTVEILEAGQARCLGCGWHGVSTFEHGRAMARCPHCQSEQPTAGRNDPCPCGSGRKYKKCCGR